MLLFVYLSLGWLFILKYLVRLSHSWNNSKKIYFALYQWNEFSDPMFSHQNINSYIMCRSGDMFSASLLFTDLSIKPWGKTMSYGMLEDWYFQGHQAVQQWKTETQWNILFSSNVLFKVVSPKPLIAFWMPPSRMLHPRWQSELGKLRFFHVL